MELQKAVAGIFNQLSDSLDQLEVDQYHHPCRLLSGNTIGQHVRHIIELFQCLEGGYLSGEVDYEMRIRDKRIENDKIFAKGLLQDIVLQISKENKPVYLMTYYDERRAEPEKISSNYFREIAYNLEHTIHHMALIRIGLLEIGGIRVDDSYGVASSTLKYRQQCVQ